MFSACGVPVVLGLLAPAVRARESTETRGSYVWNYAALEPELELALSAPAGMPLTRKVEYPGVVHFSPDKPSYRTYRWK